MTHCCCCCCWINISFRLCYSWSSPDVAVKLCFSFRRARGAYPPALGWVREGVGALTGLAGKRRTETGGSGSLRMLCKAVNMLSACNPGRHKPQRNRTTTGVRMVIMQEIILKCRVNGLFFSDLVFVTRIKSHAATSGNRCVSSLVTSCGMTPIYEIITDFSTLIRHPASYSVRS